MGNVLIESTVSADLATRLIAIAAAQAAAIDTDPAARGDEASDG